MAKFRSINPFSTVNNDTGFGTQDNYGGRFINRDGSYNIRREGQGFFSRFSLYHQMLSLSAWKFAAVLVSAYLGINVAFTLVYMLFGAHQFSGIDPVNQWRAMKEIFFFSTQTFTTVGYGRINPIGDGPNFIAAIEAMCGLISFAVVTGLIYGRFARPRSYLVFSDHAVIAPYQDKTGLMFRFVSAKDRHTLTNLDITVTAGLLVQQNGKATYQFYNLKLERSKIDSLAMNWTVVHPIDDESPLKDFTTDDIKASDIEIYILIRGFDDVFSNIVLRRTSYTWEEIIVGRKFVPMYRESEDGRTTILELHKLNDHEKV